MADNNFTTDKDLSVSDPTAYEPATGNSLILDCVELSNPTDGKYYPYATNVHFTATSSIRARAQRRRIIRAGRFASVTGAISDWTYGDGNTFTGNIWDDGTALTEPAGPTNTALPSITGTLGNGDKRTVSTGTWTGSGITYSYRWFDCGTGQTVNCMQVNAPEAGGSGVTSASYTMNSTDKPTYASGDQIKAVVTACESGGGCTNADAAAVKYVLARDGHTTARGRPIGRPRQYVRGRALTLQAAGIRRPLATRTATPPRCRAATARSHRAARE